MSAQYFSRETRPLGPSILDSSDKRDKNNRQKRENFRWLFDYLVESTYDSFVTSRIHLDPGIFSTKRASKSTNQKRPSDMPVWQYLSSLFPLQPFHKELQGKRHINRQFLEECSLQMADSLKETQEKINVQFLKVWAAFKEEVELERKSLLQEVRKVPPKGSIAEELPVITRAEENYLDGLEKKLWNNHPIVSPGKNFFALQPVPKRVDPEQYVCQVCNRGDTWENNQIVYCSRCSITVHQLCYRLKEVPAGEWVCQLCLARGKAGAWQACECCSRKGGAMVRVKLDKDQREKKQLKNKTKTNAAVDAGLLVNPSSEAFNTNLSYNYFLQPPEPPNPPPSPRGWVHLSCAYWLCLSPVSSTSPYILTGLDSLPPNRLSLTCRLCGERGPCIQCPGEGCLSAVHAECARRAREGGFIYGCKEWPYWRAYCREHMLEVKGLLKEKDKLVDKLNKFSRVMKGIRKPEKTRDSPRNLGLTLTLSKSLPGPTYSFKSLSLSPCLGKRQPN